MIIGVLRSFSRGCSFILDVVYDSAYYFYYSTLNVGSNKNKNLSAEILAHVHSIERAFSLKNTREEFGVELVQSLKSLVARIGDISQYQYEMKVFNSAIKEYNKHHSVKCNTISPHKPYRAYRHNPNDINTSYRSVVRGRVSVRSFGAESVNDVSVIKAIAMAKNSTPSVCNRQGWEVLCIAKGKLLEQVLTLQSGNSGIENIQRVLVVCSTLTSFFGTNERNQPYIDGGIFLMSLLNELHYQNVAACPLNWAVGRVKDSELKTLLSIEKSRVVISLIGVGSHNGDEINVASSHKKPLKNILRVLR